jgi:hypothetical protein
MKRKGMTLLASFFVWMISLGTNAWAADPYRVQGTTPQPSTTLVPVPTTTNLSPDAIVQGIVLEKVQAWKRSDGQSRSTVVLRNTGISAYTPAMGWLHRESYQLVGSTWLPAGGDNVFSLGPGAAYERIDLPFQNQGASHYKATLIFNERVISEKVVPIESGEPIQAAPSVLAGRTIAQAATLEGFSALVDVNSRSTFNLTVRNNTDQAFTPENGAMGLSLNVDKLNYWEGVNTFFITNIAPRGVATFTNIPFTDKGNYKLKATLTYDKGAYATQTVNIAGAAERDQRADQIFSALTVQNLYAWWRADGVGRFTLVVKNNSPLLFFGPSMGSISVQTHGFVNNTWVPAGGWRIDGIAANGTAELVDHGFNALGATKLAVELRWKTKVLRQETVIRTETRPSMKLPR